MFQLCQDESSWVEPVLSKDIFVLLKDTTKWRRWGWNTRPLGLGSSTLPLSHCAPYLRVCGFIKCYVVTYLCPWLWLYNTVLLWRRMSLRVYKFVLLGCRWGCNWTIFLMLWRILEHGCDFWTWCACEILFYVTSESTWLCHAGMSVHLWLHNDVFYNVWACMGVQNEPM